MRPRAGCTATNCCTVRILDWLVECEGVRRNKGGAGNVLCERARCVKGVQISLQKVGLDTTGDVILYCGTSRRRSGRCYGTAHYVSGNLSVLFCVIRTMCAALSTRATHIRANASFTAREETVLVVAMQDVAGN